MPKERGADLTPLERRRDAITLAAKEARERVGGHDMPATLVVFRGEETVAEIFLMGDVHGGATIAQAAFIAARGFDADVIAIASEGLIPVGPVNPLTGRDWERDDQQVLIEQHDGIAKGWVIACISVIACNRANDIIGASLAYRLDGDEVIWTDETRADEVQGALADALRVVMSADSLSQMMAQHEISLSDLGLTADAARAHQDCAVAKMFTRHPEAGDLPPELVPPAIVILGADHGSERERIIVASMGDVIDHLPN